MAAVQTTLVRDADRGADFEVGRELSVQNVITYAELAGFDLRPTWRSGLLRVAATIVHDPAGYGTTYFDGYLDLRIVGINGPPSTLARAALGADSAPLEMRFKDVGYRRLQVLGRLVVNGVARLLPGWDFPSAGAHWPRAAVTVNARWTR
jgi:hypothetical protein